MLHLYKYNRVSITICIIMCVQVSILGFVEIINEVEMHLVKVVVILQQYFYLLQNKKEYLVLWEGGRKLDT